MRWRRFALAVLAVLVVTAGLSWSSPAYALGFCEKVPTPAPPKQGLSGFLTRAPATPATGDPFADPKVPIADVYGTSWHWSLYDLGCSPDALADPAAVLNNGQANMILDTAAAGAAVLGAMERLALESGIDGLAEWVGRTADAIRPIVLGGQTPDGMLWGLFPLAAIAAGIFLAWRGRNGRYTAGLHTLLIFVVCLGLAAWTLLVPVVASRTMDGIVTQTSTVAGSAFNASLTDGATRHSLYRAWLAGQFGDADSPAAREYGPRVFKATHYTWAEWSRIQADPGAREGIANAKEAEFKKAAEEIKDAHPDLYEQFQGKRDRVGPAVGGFFSGTLMGAFALIAFFMVLMGRAIMQLLVVAAPVAAVFGLLPGGVQGLKNMWDLFMAAVIAVFKFTLAAGLMATLLGLLSRFDPVSSLFWMTVLTVAALVILKPARTFKTIMPGLDPDRQYLREFWSLVASSTVTGAVAGAVAGKTIEPEPEPGEKVPEGAEAPPDPGGPEPEPLPKPVFQQVPGTHRYVAVDPSVPGREGLESGPSRWDGVLPSGSAPAELPPGGPAELPAGTPAVAAGRVPAELPAGTPAVEGPVVGAPAAVEGPVGPAALPAPEAPPEPGPGKVQPATLTIQHNSPEHVVTQLTEVPASEGASSVVIEGEIVGVSETGIYQSPHVDTVDVDVIEIPDVSQVRDRGTDAPASELVLYRREGAGGE